MPKRKCSCPSCQSGSFEVPEFESIPGDNNQINLFIHCKKCVAELPDNESPQSYGRYEVGFTDQGVQIRCLRHDITVVHFRLMKSKSSKPRKAKQDGS